MAKILIVDDSQVFLELASTLLQLNGYEVDTAGTKNEVLEKLPVFDPDLVLVDVRMKKLDGRALCKEIKAMEVHKHIQVILISDSPELLQNYEACNADAVIGKPFDMETVIKRLEEVIKKTGK